MEIEFQQVGKRFGRHWILRDFTDRFRAGERIGVRGRNGSGKSTLLRILCGQLTPSRGKMMASLDGKPLPTAELYRYVSWAGPYLEIVEELTIQEMLNFHFGIKPLQTGLSVADLPKKLELDQVKHRKLSDCSSGMRQRVLLGTALFADTPLLLLDEPTVTLDEEAITWFHDTLNEYTRGRLVIVASNDPEDLRGCGRTIVLGQNGKP